MNAEKCTLYALQIIKADREKLLLSLPFFARALYALEPVPCTGLPCSGTNGERYFFDSRQLVEYFLSEENDTSLMYLHSVLHCMYLHIFFAQEHEDKLLWDLAADISIFDICHSIGLTADEEARLELERFRDKGVALSAQSLYRHIKKSLSNGLMSIAEIERLNEIFKVDSHAFWLAEANLPEENASVAGEEQEEDGQSGTSGAPTDVDADSHNISSLSHPQAQSFRGKSKLPNRQELLDKWKDISDSAEMGLQLDIRAKQRGEKAGHLLETLGNIRRDELDYSRFLRKFAVLEERLVIDMDAFDYNYYHYGLELYGDMPLIEPLEYKEEYAIRDFVIAIDTSGSCELKLIRKFLEKTYSILTETAVFHRQINVHIIQCDADIQEDVEVHNERDLADYIEGLTVRGRGGTDFRPVFERIAEIRNQGGLAHIRGLIYFTDGYGVFPQMPTDYKTAFAFAEADREVAVPPWAMKVYIEEEGLA